MINTLDAMATSPVLPDGVGVPLELQVSVARHHTNLAALIETLRSAGLEEAMIEISVRQLIDSYRDELVAAMRAWVREQTHD